jgi:phosphate starvation-inducible PhoH-like protein
MFAKKIFNLITVWILMLSIYKQNFCCAKNNFNILSIKNNFNTLSIKIFKPKTENQQIYQKLLDNQNENLIIATGPPGSGKTLMACISAINHLKEGTIQKIIITRPTISIDENIGFLPGSIETKMKPWTIPIFDIFEKYYTKSQIKNMIDIGQIEICPLGFMQGRTFDFCFVIGDEMEHSTIEQMYLFLTRLGLKSRMVITGDLAQNKKCINNGLHDLISKFKMNQNMNNINLVELDNEDVQRSELVQQIVKMYNYN